MPGRRLTKITGRVVPRSRVAPNKENPFARMDSKEREANLKRVAGQVWASICLRRAQELAAQHENRPADGAAPATSARVAPSE